MKKNNLLGFCICIFLFAMLRHPQEIISTGEHACFLWLERVLPSLFPFMVGCQLLIETGFAEKIATHLEPFMYPLFGLSGIAALPFFLGLLSGYPMGAKITADLYNKGKLSLADAQHILSFSNNAGPLFIIGTVATGFFFEPFWGYVLLFSSILSAILTGVLYRMAIPKLDSFPTKSIQYANKPAPHLLSRSITNALYTLIQIGGYILLSSVVIEILSLLHLFSFIEWLCSSFLSHSYCMGIGGGLLEMTTGIFHLSLAEESLFSRLLGVSFLLSFGGCSILGQTFGILADIPINKKQYVLCKIINGILNALFFTLFYPIALKHAKKAIPVTHMFTEIAFSPNFTFVLPWIFCLVTSIWAVYYYFIQN